MLKNKNGFTLMEVMVALFILSIMSITAVSGLNAVLRSQSKQVGVAHQLQALQFSYTWIEQDLGEYIARDVLNPHGERLLSLMFSNDTELSKVGLEGEILLVLTRGGISAPNNLSSLQRVAYVFKDQQLIRYTWPVLDSVTSTVVQPQVILHNIASIQLRYLSDRGVYYTNWRDYSGTALLPMAIEWKITDEDGRSVVWLFAITGGGVANEITT